MAVREQINWLRNRRKCNIWVTPLDAAFVSWQWRWMNSMWTWVKIGSIDLCKMKN